MNNTMNTKKGKELIGSVVAVGLPKTIKVKITHVYRHPIYRKAVVKSRLFAVHNEIDGIAVGDMVRIVETRPISKTKHFRVKEKVTSK